MPPRRTREPERPVTIELDGDRIVADANAPIATALVGAGHLLLARSPKFHRPRGPSCFRGGCDGCLMRVDGVPNVMTCLRTPAEGTRVERQNVVLSAKLDLLRATDWFFPHGMNHHEIFAGVPGVSQVMQAFARRVSGLGELPETPAALAKEGVPTLTTDVLVVGGGPSGLAAARALKAQGLRVVLVEDRPALGGALRAFPRGARVRMNGATVDVDRALEELVAGLDGVDVHLGATVLGVLEGDDWVFDDPARGLVRVEARARVVATGGHDATPLFEGNDLPGVFSARAAGALLRDGVLVGERIVVDGEGPHGRAFAEAAREEGAHVEVLASATVASVRGLSRVRSVVARDPSGKKLHLDCDAVVVDGGVAPSYELAAEASAALRHGPAGYAVLVDDEGRVLLSRGAELTPSERLFALGEVVGRPFGDHDPARLAKAVARVVGGAR